MNIKNTFLILFLFGFTHNSSAAMHKDTWLKNFTPNIKSKFCSRLPNPRKNCKSEVIKLLDYCINDVLLQYIPEYIESEEQAYNAGGRIGDCVYSHYIGGEELKAFKADYKLANKSLKQD